MPGLLSPQPLLPSVELDGAFATTTKPLPVPDHIHRHIHSPSPAFPKHPTPYRRSKTPAHYSRRRRPTTRVDYRAERPIHAFDKLPWIASLNAPIDNIHPCDIADLSLIPDPPRPSNSGPVPRRKAPPPRPTPFASLLDPHSDDLPRNFKLFPRDIPSRPSTPCSRFDLTRVTFRHLMPVVNECIPTTNDL